MGEEVNEGGELWESQAFSLKGLGKDSLAHKLTCPSLSRAAYREECSGLVSGPRCRGRGQGGSLWGEMGAGVHCSFDKHSPNQLENTNGHQI